MATITERTRKNGRKIFRVEIRIKGNPTLSKSFDRKTDATIWAQKQEAAIVIQTALWSSTRPHLGETAATLVGCFVAKSS